MGYRPRVQRGGSTFDLPLPLTRMNEAHRRKVKSVHVPLQNGVIIANSQLSGMQVTFSGKIVINNPQDIDRSVGKVTSIIVEKQRLEEWLIEDDDPFTFYRYVKNATVGGAILGDNTNTKWYADCVCTSLNFDFSVQSVEYLPYAFTLLVPAGVEYKDA